MMEKSQGWHDEVSKEDERNTEIRSCCLEHPNMQILSSAVP
jgi:hypothetical protein